MRIAVTGSRGLIGASLVQHLRSEGHEVTRIVRGRAQPDEVLWNPEEGTIEADKLTGVDAVVHLAGAGVGDHRWSASYKKSILSSRVNGTTDAGRGSLSVAARTGSHGERVGRGVLRITGR